MYAVVHNSWITQKECYQHAKDDSMRAKLKRNLEADTAARFARGEAVWFCSKCKYPPCSSCQKERSELRRQRFMSWSCDDCQECNEKFKNLQKIIDSCHGQLPSREAEEKKQQKAAKFINHERDA